MRRSEFIQSLLVHGAVFLAALLLFRQERSTRSVRHPTPPFHVEIAERPAGRGNDRTSAPPGKRTHQKQRQKGKSESEGISPSLPPLAKLGIPLPGNGAGASSTGPGSAAGGGQELGDGFYGNGSGRKVLEDPRRPIWRHLFQTIEGNLTYPAELRKAGITGEADAELVFSDQGVLSREESRYRSGSRLLRVHVIQVLRRALRDPLPEHTRRHAPGAFRVNCRFTFERVFKRDEVLSLGFQTEGAGGLHFYRNTALTAPLNFQLQVNPYTQGIDPAIDVLEAARWVGEALEPLVSSRARIDPLQKYRDDPEY